jgi:hypothetical protein
LPVVGVLALLLVVGQLVPALLGLEVDTTRPTIAPVMVWVVFWLVVPFASAFIGDWYTLLNPWRTLGRWFGVGSEEKPKLLRSHGVGPAAFVLLAFAWFELIYPSSASPVALGVAALVYTVALLIAAAVTGRETALASIDAFTPYNRLISAISPLGRAPDGRLVWRGWLRSLAVIPEWPGLALFVVTIIGSVTFDGASGTAWYRTGLGDFGQTMAGSTIMLLTCVGLVGGAYLVACNLASRSSGRWAPMQVASRFAHSLVPIALAYAVAHYMTLVIFEGQQLIAAISDPFGLGWDLFGTAERKVDFFITATEPVWYAQVAVIVVGHVCGVILAHDRALADFGVDAVRSQYAMLVLMVALTTLGLLILAG